MAIEKRYDFVLLFDVTDGNPNGDPDAGNLPRVDAESGHGLVTDVCIKRKIRNYVQIKGEERAPNLIFVKEKSILNDTIESAYSALKIDLQNPPIDPADGKRRKKAGSGQGREVDKAKMFLCQNYYDIRTFGAVLSTGANAGQVRGPVQLTFARSIDPIVPMEHCITRMAVTTLAESEKQDGANRTMGRKFTVPYGIYRAHGFVSAPLADQTGFSQQDLDLLWDALINMFDHDRSASRGAMAVRGLYVFEHQSKMGNISAQFLFDRIHIKQKDSTKAARSFSDYTVIVDDSNLDGVTLIRKVG